jgi:hypothetical protein
VTGNWMRRLAGLLKARLADLNFNEVLDFRHRRGRRWKLESFLNAVLAGMLAGCQGLAETERLTAQMSLTCRRLLGLRGRVPDTTMRDALVKADLFGLRHCLHSLVKAAIRRKALAPVDLPFGVVSMDGKCVASTAPQGTLAHKATRADGRIESRIWTVTSMLSSAAAKVCLDALPMPRGRNEMSYFEFAFHRLVEAYGRTNLFQLIT